MKILPKTGAGKWAICVIVIIILWLCGLSLPIIVLEPTGFWQKLAMCGVEFAWAGVTGVIGFLVIMVLAHIIDD